MLHRSCRIATDDLLETERRAYDPYVRVMISCQTTPQEGATKRCVQSFCRNCLEKFYGTDVDAMLANGEDSNWVCPVCRDCCAFSFLLI